MVTMVERIATVETKLDNIDKKLDYFIQTADKRYASKWIEKVSWVMVCAFITAIVTKIVGLW